MKKRSRWRLPRPIIYGLFVIGFVVGGWLGWKIHNQRKQRRQLPDKGLVTVPITDSTAQSSPSGSSETTRRRGKRNGDAEQTGRNPRAKFFDRSLPDSGGIPVLNSGDPPEVGGATDGDPKTGSDAPASKAFSGDEGHDQPVATNLYDVAMVDGSAFDEVAYFPAEDADAFEVPPTPMPVVLSRDSELPLDVQLVSTVAGHPLDPALKYAREGLARIRAKVRDYTANFTKRERINGKIVEQKILIKVRQRKREGDELKTPMSVYMKFLAPRSVAGREVIWVENRDAGKIVAHEGGFKNLLRVYLKPTGFLAMMDNRYPITEIGIENLIVKLIERGERDKLLGDCQVRFLENEKQGDRTCRVIEVTHPKQEPKFDFYQARIYIDKELEVPIRYTALVWPKKAGGDPILDEEYIYEDIKLNVGLRDSDFDPDNAKYNYP